MTNIIFATKNKGKISEINEIMAGTNFNIISMEDAGINIDVVEDGFTYEENAIKKAVSIMKISNKIVLAEDSGIEIDFLDKKPGVNSSSFLGGNSVYKERNNKIIEMMQNVKGEERSARFVSVIALSTPNGDTLTTRGTLEGHIAYESKGENGFGYDGIFFVKEYNMTTAQMHPSLKNKISHRAKALIKLKDKLLNWGY